MTNHRISINWKSGSKKNQFLTSLMTDRHLSLLEVSSVRSHSSQPNVPWCHENVETVPWLPCIWRQDRVSLLCRWKTTWYSQEKNYGQDPRKHIEDINQYHVVDLWWQRSLHRWWWYIQETQVAGDRMFFLYSYRLPAPLPFLLFSSTKSMIK